MGAPTDPTHQLGEGADYGEVVCRRPLQRLTLPLLDSLTNGDRWGQVWGQINSSGLNTLFNKIASDVRACLAALDYIRDQGLAISANVTAQQALELGHMEWQCLLSWAVGPSMVYFPLTPATKNTSL